MCTYIFILPNTHTQNTYAQVSYITYTHTGTYGAVFLARAPNGERVALKKIRKQKEVHALHHSLTSYIKHRSLYTIYLTPSIYTYIHVKIHAHTYAHTYTHTHEHYNHTQEGFPITAIREIKILKMLDHENIVRLKDVVSSHSHIDNREGNVFMVFEFCDHDLTGIMESGQRLSEGVTKYVHNTYTWLHAYTRVCMCAPRHISQSGHA